MSQVSTERRQPSSQVAVQVVPALLNDEQAAAFLGVSVRKFHELRQEPYMREHAPAIVLGPRLLRWSRIELEAAVSAMPRQQVPATEPEHLQRGREARRVIVRDGRISKVLGA